ncbi:leucine-rich PPR motif-containing protein, mitochondrial [Antennarius striatus]|uniref:leucine-rich PPR motif-containing protein, mitochondrial n=1 Tax=Antennarius striatus TaxID=241820 RepID=UPI0035B4D52C
MAALLRSVRLLKLSPSSLFQISGAKRSGPPLSRLFSGVIAGSRNGVCPRQISLASENSFSRVWSYPVQCMGIHNVATEQNKESHAVVAFDSEDFDKTLSILDSCVRRNGYITQTLLHQIFNDICEKGHSSSNHALLLLRSCGSFLAELPLDDRTSLAHKIWDKMKELGVQYDVSHYNALLKVYIQNEFKFSPTDFLAKMEADNICPNRVTYQRLVAAYCQNGNLDAASTILSLMKTKDIPITENVFSSLVTGHGRAGDIESAKSILTVMKEAKISPGPETYVGLLNVHAERGDMDSLKETLEMAKSNNCNLMNEDIMQVILTLAKSGHQQHVEEMIKYLKHSGGYKQDATVLCLTLITLGLEDTAFQILKTFRHFLNKNFDNMRNMGNFFLKHCVAIDMPLEKLVFFCNDLEESRIHAEPLTHTLYCALSLKKPELSLELMKLLKEKNQPIRSRYFWPLLNLHVKNKDMAGMTKVLLAMQEHGMSIDGYIFTRFIKPIIPSFVKAQQVLQDSGVSLKMEQVINPVIRSGSYEDLDKTYSLLLNPSLTRESIRMFCHNIVNVFKKFENLEKMVKITEALKEIDVRNKNTSQGNVSYLLYGLIIRMSEEEVKAQTDNLRQFFQLLNAKEITIPGNTYKSIKGILVSYNVPELCKDLLSLRDLSHEKAEGVSKESDTVTVAALEERVEEMKRNGKPFDILLKRLFQAVLADNDLKRAFELKMMYEEKLSMLDKIKLMGLCLRQNNVEEALNLRRELNQSNPSLVIDTSKYLFLVKGCCMIGNVEEAINILKEMSQKEVKLDQNIGILHHVLEEVAATGDAATVKRLLDTIFSIQLAKPRGILFKPLIVAHLNNDDTESAVQTTFDIMKDYKILSSTHDLLVHLLKNKETDQMQKVIDFLNEARGEMAMLYDLFFAFLKTGRKEEAKKIIETPGIRAKSGPLKWFTERCIANNEMEVLEEMTDMTRKLYDCDREEMYSNILHLCRKRNDWQKAMVVWTKMQEENIIPRSATLYLLADIMSRNGQTVPFELPKTFYRKTEAEPKETQNVEDSSDKKIDRATAYSMVQRANEEGTVLSADIYNIAMRAMLAEGKLEDAMQIKESASSMLTDFKLTEVTLSMIIITQSKRGLIKDALETLKSMLSTDQMPSQLAITSLIESMAIDGNVEGLKELDTLMKEGVNSYVYTVASSRAILTHFQKGNDESALALLEHLFTKPIIQYNKMFPLIENILGLENDVSDKLSALVERLANQFACYKPVTMLFLKLLDMKREDEAKAILDRHNGVAEQRDPVMAFLNFKAKIPGQVEKIKSILNTVPHFINEDWVKVTLIKCHYMDGDFESARALYEQMREEGTNINELTLKRLAVLYKNQGEEVPFDEPPNSWKFYAKAMRRSSSSKTDQ